MSSKRAARYQAYMLRMWQIENEDGLRWRASLQQVPGGERQGFDDLEKLFAYLRQQVTDCSAPRGKEGEVA